MRELIENSIKTITRNISNLPGWRTKRKIVVFESDDWGSIRMPSKEVYNRCLSAGYRVDLNPFERYDSLASQDDLELLFDLLYSSRDKNGNHPVFTANCVVANPDFDRIKWGNFKNYFFEPITDTFQRYPAHAKNFDLWLTGKNNRVFYPQFHAREHLNVSMFMGALQQCNPEALFGFENQMPGCIVRGPNGGGNYYVEATLYNSESDKYEKLKIYLEGLALFEKMFGYISQSIIPPNYTWSRDFNKPVSDKGVKYIQGIRKMREPLPDHKFLFKSRILGDVNDEGQIALIRNCSFEPTLSPRKDTVDECLSDISITFRMHKPAIISSHRINYVGFIDSANRDRNLRSLQKIFNAMTKKWPNIEFMTSEDLGKLILNSYN